MNRTKSISAATFYTKDHEWINFRESLAYTGICSFKLLGFKEIHEISFDRSIGLKKRGEVFATIKYKDYHIEAHMPIDGQIIELNSGLLSEDKSILLRSPENSGWIALILPTEPSQRMGLLALKEYELRNKNKFIM